MDQDAQDVASPALEHAQACRSRWRLLCCNKGDFQQSLTALGFLESSHWAEYRLFPGLFTPSLGFLHTGWKALSQGQEAGGAGHGLPSRVAALTAGA